MKFKILYLFLILFSHQSFSDDYLISEMEALKTSLSKEDPDRLELTLRLADLYFDVSIQESVGEDVIFKREKALKLYKDALFQRDGLPELSNERINIVKFQVARVLNKLHRGDEARVYYQEVFDSKNVDQNMRREAAIALAEYYDENLKFENSDFYYLQVISLCQNITDCNYAHYKRAWLHYKEVKLESAISELKKALYEPGGKLSEKVIGDLLLFFSSKQTDGKEELAFIKKIEKENKRSDLIKKLVEAFYSAGNRVAGTKALVALNQRSPDAFYEARLVEEFYGHRDFGNVGKYLNFLSTRQLKDISSESVKPFKSMLKRILVQFDSEAQSNKVFENKTLEMIDIYLTIFPNDDMRVKLQQAWLKFQNDEKKKVKRLGLWINEDKEFGFDKEHIRKLRTTRLSLAQKNKLYDVEINEALALKKMSLKKINDRKMDFIVGYRLYEQGKLEDALVFLLPLTKTKNIDDYAIKAQNLSLDIYNKKKDYSSIIRQANLWLIEEQRLKGDNLKNELSEMLLIKRQAMFEKAVAMGEKKAALNVFFDFCLQDIFKEKSCENARVLANKLEDQAKTIALLEKKKDLKRLRFEYEAMGEYAKAAALQEKFDLNPNATVEDYIKVSLLYELAADEDNRKRVLNNLVAKIKNDNDVMQNEQLIFRSLVDADLINERSMILPWSMAKKLQIAQYLSQKQSKMAVNFITNRKKYSGPVWARNVIKNALDKFNKQSKTKFYGRYSKTLFKRRIRRLDSAVEYVKKYLNEADEQTRIYLLDMTSKAYAQLSSEILSTPLPKGLTDDVLEQVQNSLSQMASPYQTLASDYKRLLNEEIKGIEDPDIKKQRVSEITSNNVVYVDLIKDRNSKIEPLKNNLDGFAEITKSLKMNPFDVNALRKAKLYFSNQGNIRLASYFKGRLSNITESSDEL